MSLAGKPPFATDEPDSYYESSSAPQRRVRQPRPEDPNKRTSAYDVYDNYTDNDANRQSGMGALGAGFLNGSMDDDDSDDEDEPKSTRPAPSKNAALAAATGIGASGQNAPLQPPSPPKQQPIAAPRPGYSAPIAALNLARPEPVAIPQGRQPEPRHPIENPFEPPSPQAPQASRIPQPQRSGSFSPPSSPLGTAPHPLQPPKTPIVAVFARPANGAGVTFSEATPRPPKPIIRGNSEETLLPKRGEQGDDFWRRFSMVAKEPNSNKESAWLKQTQARSNSLSRWVWITGICLLLAIGAGAGLGWYFTHNKPAHQQPTAIGGSASETVGGTVPIVGPTGSKGATGAASSSQVFHVTPTHTVQRREPEFTLLPIISPRAGEFKISQAHKKRRLHWS
ncbi:hypothetical protein BDN72DRAFT_761361 [Pluteus cervinus]|uniref:Uncharacterized protein n=1 Tax=Pluteus cervinus TaxID=181527 RepID=A0ACD3B6D9_9AGAR|nr:hypothetical protein BDN72DRAFT_761361 [Pluteus cervinus]